MKNLLYCRRSTVTILGIICLTGLGIYQGTDVSYAVAGCVAAICGANAFEKVGQTKAVKYGNEG